MRHLWRLAVWALGIVGAFIMLAAQVSAQSAKSNIESWLNLFGLKGLGSIVPANADAWATVIAAVLLVGALFVWLYFRSENEQTNRPNAKACDLIETLGKYAALDPVTLVMASFLMTDQAPETKVDGNAEAHLMYENLRNAIRAGQMLIAGWTNREYARMVFATYGNTSTPDAAAPKIQGDTQVSQQELIAFAMAHGLSPIFLRSKMQVNRGNDRLTEKRRLLHIETMAKIAAPRAFDFRATDRLKAITLKNAAHYWAEQRPSKEDDEIPLMAEVVLNELVHAANNGNLKAVPPIYPDWYIAIGVGLAKIIGVTVGVQDKYSVATRTDLRAYAESKGERPLFLFPEDR